MWEPGGRAGPRVKEAWRAPALCGLLILCASATQAQTTQAWVTGMVLDSVSGSAIGAARVICTLSDSQIETLTKAASDGRFLFASLSPGEYSIRVEAGGYQAQELHRLEVPVAGALDLEFRLRPEKDIWEARQYRSYFPPGSGQVLTFYGPDVDTSRIATFEANHGHRSNLETTVSTVIDSKTIDAVPLAGRDPYTLLVLLPGVTSDTATGRGLGYSVIGQRPSSSNYLLDGLENNNLTITGPLGIVAPEALSEYRISTNNFSAEYGRTSGFLANVITRPGTAAWHARAYLNFMNESLNANGFQENRKGFARAPLKDIQPGASVSGPLAANRLFASASFQLERYRSRNDPAPYALPTASFIANTPANSFAGKLFGNYPAAVTPQGPGDVGLVSIATPVEIDQGSGVARLDWNPTATQRFFARGLISRYRQPGLLPNPYPAFSSPFHLGAVAIGAGWTWSLGTRLTQEIRAGRSGDSSRYDRPHPEVPQLSGIYATFDDISYPVSLPSSASDFGYRNLTSNWEVADNWSLLAGIHHFRFGGGVLSRGIESSFTADRDGSYTFGDMNSFRLNQPVSLLVAFDRATPGFEPVPYDRAYRYRQTDLFAQDAIRLTSRVSLSLGVRYDHFGAPVNDGPVKDLIWQYGPGPTFPLRAAGAYPGPLPTGDQRIFTVNGGGWANRTGVTYDLTGSGTTMLRASYGIFYDRPFDNLWQSLPVNRQQAGGWSFPPGTTLPFLSPPLDATVYGTYTPLTQFHSPVIFQPSLKNPMIQNAFLGMERRIGSGITLEENLIYSRGRRLWTTDIINRFAGKNGELYYRANQGSSDYHGLATTVRFRFSGWSGQVSYTWSHAADNQSDALAGLFESYNTLGEATKPPYVQLASFTEEFTSHADKARADFDQRHNLVLFGVYQFSSESAGILRRLHGWSVSGLGAIRSGLPYSVFVTSTNTIINQTANLKPGISPFVSPEQAIPGGKLILNWSAFQSPGPTDRGTSGRNAFIGPGLISADLSVARVFHLTPLGESGRLTVRADAYNAFNHANLNNPVAAYYSPHFGQALFGRMEMNSGFPGLAPLNETARRVQLLLRVEF